MSRAQPPPVPDDEDAPDVTAQTVAAIVEMKTNRAGPEADTNAAAKKNLA